MRVLSPLGGQVRRAFGKPPQYVAWRLGQELGHQVQRAELRAARGGRGALSRAAILRADGGRALSCTARNAPLLGAWREAADEALTEATLREDTIRRATAAQRRIVELFGAEPIEAGIPPRWNADVRSDFDWPPAHYLSIDYRNVGRPSDVKVAWELSRLRHLVHLAQGVAVTSEHDWETGIDQDLRDWHRANPLGWSVNWTCAMEVALRAVNLLCIDGILLTHGSDYRSRPLVVASLYQHGWFLQRNLEISDVNGNHFLANAVGLIWLGRAFGDFGEASRWLDRGCEMAAEAARDQVLVDGVDHEGSLPYHVLVTELFLLARRGAGDRLNDLDPTLNAMLDVICSVAGADGRVPDLGDDDGGRVGAFSDVPSNDVRRVLAVGAALLGHSSAAAVAADGSWEDALWLLGPRAVRDAQRSDAPGERKRHFAAAGVIVLGEAADRVVLDAGPIGFRGRGGHGHLDAMSFEAVLDGEVAVRDSGTGSYTGDTGLRELLRSATAHTVVIVDRLQYADLGGESALWRITGDAPPTVLDLVIEPDRHLVRVEQSLPAERGRALHRRTLEWRPGVLEWTDEVIAPPQALVEHLVQLPDGCVLAPEGIRNERFRYDVGTPASAKLELQVAPWSRRYGSVARGSRAIVSYSATDGPSTVTWSVAAADR